MSYPIIGDRCPVSESIRSHIRSVPRHTNTYEQEVAERLATVTTEDLLDQLMGVDAFDSAIASGDAESVGLVVLAARRAYAERLAQTWFYGQTNVQIDVECDKALSRVREGKTIATILIKAMAEIKRLGVNAPADAAGTRLAMTDIATKALAAIRSMKVSP